MIGYRTGPQPGYWRKNKESDNFKECPNGASCLGGALKNTTEFENANCDVNFLFYFSLINKNNFFFLKKKNRKY